MEDGVEKMESAESFRRALGAGSGEGGESSWLLPGDVGEGEDEDDDESSAADEEKGVVKPSEVEMSEGAEEAEEDDAVEETGEGLGESPTLAAAAESIDAWCMEVCGRGCWCCCCCCCPRRPGRRCRLLRSEYIENEVSITVLYFFSFQFCRCLVLPHT